MKYQFKIWLYVVLITILCVLGSHYALSDDWVIRGGPSLDSDAKPDGAAKYFGLRREEDTGIHGIEWATEGGAWVDNAGNGRRTSGLFKAQLGITPGPDTGLYGKAFLGPCVITSPDALLGGPFQLCTDLGFGVRDRNTLMGVVYQHTSSAGIELPNQGRDFLVLEAGLRW